MCTRLYFTNPAGSTARFDPFKRRTAGAAGASDARSPTRTLHLPLLPLYLFAICVCQPALGQAAVTAAVVLAVMTATSEILTKRLVAKRSSQRRLRGERWWSPTH